MTLRIMLIIIFVCLSKIAAASEGIIYGAVYECRAISVTEAMVKACSSQYPDISARSSKAYSAWLSRNGTKAEKAAQACIKELRTLAKTESEEQQMLLKMDEIEKEMIEEFKKKINSEGVSACSEAISQLEEGIAGVKFK